VFFNIGILTLSLGIANQELSYLILFYRFLQWRNKVGEPQIEKKRESKGLKTT